MNVLSVDVEDWFHLLEVDNVKNYNKWKDLENRVVYNTNFLLKLFKKYDCKCTFFILGWIASEYPELVKLIKASGHEIGCHSHYHRLIYELDRKEFENDTMLATEAIRKAIGEKVIMYRAPGFSITQDCRWALKTLSDMGYQIDCSIFPYARAHGGIPNYEAKLPHVISLPQGQTMKIFPMSATNLGRLNLVATGGGYFRLLPYFLIRHCMHRNEYNMTYFHPRDFDPDQPVVTGLSSLKKFKSYVGLRTSRKKLERLVNDFNLMSVGEACERIDFDCVESFEI